MPFTIEQIAEVCHEANRIYCKSIGDASQQPWDTAPEWQKQSAIEGVQKVLDNPDHSPRDSHASWMSAKLRSGWTYAPVKDPEKRTHPCILPFDALPPEHKAKDAMFVAIASALLETSPRRKS